MGVGASSGETFATSGETVSSVSDATIASGSGTTTDGSASSDPSDPSDPMTSGATEGSTEATTGEGTTSGGVTDLGPWSSPTRVDELDVPGAAERSPSLTADELEIYLAIDDGTEHLFVAHRADAGQPWGAPEPVVELTSSLGEGSPRIDPEGLVLLFHRRRQGNLRHDLHVSTRTDRSAPWGPPVPIDGLNSMRNERAAAPAWTLDAVVFCSDRRANGGFGFDLFEAAVNFDTLVFDPPELLGELSGPGHECSPHLSPDGLTVVFEAVRAEFPTVDLWTASRPERATSFGEPERLSDLSTDDFDELDPWISEDGTTMYLARGDEDLSIHVSTRSWR
jgi:hypothetical protein